MGIVYIIGGLLYNLFMIGSEDGKWGGFIAFIAICVALSIFGNAVG